MNRRAILLAQSPKDKPLPDLHSDLETFYSFLRSNPGGAWNVDEIRLGENLTRDQIHSEINEAKQTDYVLVYFSGFGEEVKMGLPWLEMRMLLNSGETITEREINSGSPRCTLILDCCHKIPGRDAKTALIEPSTLLKQGEGSFNFYHAYEESLEAAESGLVKIYATAVGATPDAYSFTQHLLNESNTWIRNNKGVLPLQNAVALAGDAMKRESPEQRLEYQGGRRLHHFPFAVRI